MENLTVFQDEISDRLSQMGLDYGQIETISEYASEWLLQAFHAGTLHGLKMASEEKQPA